MFGITHLESIFRLRRNQVLDLHKQKLKTAREWYVKMQVLFFKCLSSLSVFLTFLLVQINYLVSLANVKEFLMKICLLNVNINVSINDNSFKYIWVACYLKLIFYCLTYSAMPNLNSADFTTQNSHQRTAIWNNMFDYIVCSTEYRNSFYHFPSRGITCKSILWNFVFYLFFFKSTLFGENLARI